MNRKNNLKNNLEKNPPKYFGSWIWNHLPAEPREPLTEQEAKKRKAYYLAYYNEAGHLIIFEKYLDGHIDRTVLYGYWDNGKVRERVTRQSDGSEKIDMFDRNGQRIE